MSKNITIKVVREIFTENSTIGTLFINDIEICHTLEDKYRDLSVEPKVYGETAIPYGEYDVILSWSHKFQMVTPEILEVPEFKFIRVHPGNFPKDTLGCILVGRTFYTDFVGDSRSVFKQIMVLLHTYGSLGYKFKFLVEPKAGGFSTVHSISDRNISCINYDSTT